MTKFEELKFYPLRKDLQDEYTHRAENPLDEKYLLSVLRQGDSPKTHTYEVALLKEGGGLLAASTCYGAGEAKLAYAEGLKRYFRYANAN